MNATHQQRLRESFPYRGDGHADEGAVFVELVCHAGHRRIVNAVASRNVDGRWCISPPRRDLGGIVSWGMASGGAEGEGASVRVPWGASTVSASYQREAAERIELTCRAKGCPVKVERVPGSLVAALDRIVDAGRDEWSLVMLDRATPGPA